MKTFIEVCFWCGVVSFVIRIIEMACREWPQERKPKSLGHHTAETILGAAITIWAAILIYSR